MTTPDKKMRDLLQDFKIAMLVTRTPSGELRSRPMVLADVEPEGTLWMISEKRCGKVEEISDESHVNVAMQTSNKFASVSGVSTAVDDRRKIAELWNESWKTWFPGGPDDPNLTLLRIDAQSGEYWDNSGMNGIMYLLEAGRAYLTGDKPDAANDPKIHGKVAM